ncbi:MAG: OsmC family protein [Gemmatimonadota bacterium]
MDETGFEVRLTLQRDYQIAADFGIPEAPDLTFDEPRPLGEGAGPNAARVLAAAVGDCLSSSYLFCMRRAHIDVKELKTTVTGTFTRNANGRLRIGGLKVRLEPLLATDKPERAARCLELFEDFCVVTQSVRDGIDVQVAVTPAPEFAKV